MISQRTLWLSFIGLAALLWLIPDRPTTEVTEHEPTVEYSSDESSVSRPTRSQVMRAEERAAAGEPEEPTTGEFARGIDDGDAGLLARLLTRFPEAPEAVRAKELLRSGTIYCLERNGRLADQGDPILLSAFGLHCESSELETLRALGLDLRIEEKQLYVRYLQNYARGYGPKIGKKRLAPHPKQVRIRFGPIVNRDGETETLRIDTDTPRVDVPKLGASGLSDEEVWRRTLEGPIEEIREALGIRN